jgi:hypothetical protein
MGSSTLVVSTIGSSGEYLNTAFIGDSKYMVLRKIDKKTYSIIHESKTQ